MIKNTKKSFRKETPDNDKKAKKNIFKISYLIYVGVLVILVAAALLHVNSVLNEYEGEHPQRHIEKAVELLQKEAKDGTLWKKDGVPSMEGGEFESSADPKKDFIKKINGDIKFTAQKQINDTECSYGILSDGMQIAEVVLRKVGQPELKLAIINIQKYELVSYTPVSHKYTLNVPKDVELDTEVFITVNGTKLTKEHGKTNSDGDLIFTFENIYSKPVIEIKDTKGNVADYRLPDKVNGEIEYDNTFYTLTLPELLTVSVDGEKLSGETLSDGRLCYKIRLAKKAEVTLDDVFGNSVKYHGSSSVPLTYYTFMTSDKCTVTVDGNKVPDSVMTISANPEYKNFEAYVPNLPKLPVYSIVILKEDVNIVITDSTGKNVPYEKDKKVQDLTGISSPTPLDTVPANIAKEIDVLKTLENWSLFMSADLNFNGISGSLIKNSHQYNVAWAYYTSIDRTFVSRHTLHNPPFKDESVTNFVWLTDNCFSVDIKFVKQMWVTGNLLDDEMNERCYFVKYDDTNDNKNNPTWKLVGMKEVVNDAE
ncbi:MAG: hypothetical protein E7593_05860 [Ruminococcaceae bacterium]|nr:hypothetical protein [Oscillospiraceae bacterium]MBE6897174.1 hypothetical protein [Oscillospiraceae bacterium]